MKIRNAKRGGATRTLVDPKTSPAMAVRAALRIARWRDVFFWPHDGEFWRKLNKQHALYRESATIAITTETSPFA
jgi:hypothetical protein